MSLRIALTHGYSWPEVRRGGERFLHELASSLGRRGHDVTIFAGASVSSVSEEEGVRVVRMARPSATSRLEAERKFGRRVLRPLVLERFDAVHSFLPSDAAASVIARGVRRRRRTVYTCLGIPVRSYWDSREDARAHRRVLRDVDVYGCMSRFALSCLGREYGRAGVLTPGGVRIDVFRPCVPRSDEPTLLYSGVLDEPRKGVATLLEATALISRREPRLRLLLSGGGDVSPILAAAPAAARERTELLGWGSEEMPARYSSAWATVLPSTNEAFGIAVIESLACGTPVVVGDHSALPELVTPGAGEAVTPGDPVALADACERALTLARQPSTRDVCRGSAMRFDWDSAITPHIESLYLVGDRDAGA